MTIVLRYCLVAIQSPAVEDNRILRSEKTQTSTKIVTKSNVPALSNPSKVKNVIYLPSSVDWQHTNVYSITYCHMPQCTSSPLVIPLRN